MARLRYLFAHGTLSMALGGNLTDTTIQSAEFATLPAVVAPNTLTLVLDYLGEAGTPEVVLVTAHAAGSTSLTATRQQETGSGASAVRSHVINTKWAHAWTPLDADHGNLDGLGDDDHGQYLNTARHDSTTRHAVGTVVPAGTPGASAVGDSAAAGVATTAARSDHRHAREAFDAGTPADVHQTTGASGSAATLPHSDHVHAQPAATPRGVLDHKKVTANQGSIGSSQTNLTGLAAVVTVPAGRSLRIKGVVSGLLAGGPGVVSLLILDEADTQLQQAPEDVTGWVALEATAIIEPAAGSHVYRLAMLTSSGTLTMEADTVRPAYITVEDIGAA